jgi:hypothetical protein
MVPNHFFQLYFQKNDIDDFCAWDTSRYHEEQQFFFNEYDEIVFNKIYSSCFIIKR